MNAEKNEIGWAATVARNSVRLAYWTAAWVASMALATFGPPFIWSGKLLSVVAVFVNLAIGFGMILAHKRLLWGLDEMQQKIQLEAMGLALGVGIVAGLAYSNLQLAGILEFDAEIGLLVLLMGLTYMAAVVAGLRRYR